AGVLQHLAERVRFTDAELARLGIAKDALTPFVIDPDDLPYVSDRDIGDTPLEFHPLLARPGAVILASPSNVSLAVRSVLISTALGGGMGESFQEAIQQRQERFADESHFWPVPEISLSSLKRFSMRASVGSYEP